MLYSKSTGGFYDRSIHGDNIPSDATDESKWQFTHAELLSGQSQGKRIAADADGYPVLVNPPVPTADVIWGSIKSERSRRKAGGVKVGEHWFHTDDTSRIQYGILDGKATRAALPGNTVLHPGWKTMSGVKTPMTVALLRQVLDAGIASEAAIFNAAETHKAALEASTDPAAYDFSAGWPAIYSSEVPV